MTVPQDLVDEIDMARNRLEHFCDLVNAGQRQGGGREFRRQIDGVFGLLDEAVKRNSGEHEK